MEHHVYDILSVIGHIANPESPIDSLLRYFDCIKIYCASNSPCEIACKAFLWSEKWLSVVSHVDDSFQKVCMCLTTLCENAESIPVPLPDDMDRIICMPGHIAIRFSWFTSSNILPLFQNLGWSDYQRAFSRNPNTKPFIIWFRPSRVSYLTLCQNTHNRSCVVQTPNFCDRYPRLLCQEAGSSDLRFLVDRWTPLFIGSDRESFHIISLRAIHRYATAACSKFTIIWRRGRRFTGRSSDKFRLNRTHGYGRGMRPIIFKRLRRAKFLSTRLHRLR